MRWRPAAVLLFIGFAPIGAQPSLEKEALEKEAEAQYASGTAQNRNAHYDQSDSDLGRALASFVQLGNRLRVAEIHSILGQNAYYSGRRAQARAEYELALAGFTVLQDWGAVARVHYSFCSITSGAELQKHIQRGLELARKSGDQETQANLLRVWADSEYASDDFDVAFDRLNQARSILEELDDRRNLARVLTSLGRLYRVHGHPDQALDFYRRARDLQQQTGDVQGVIQSLNAVGVALNYLGKASEALRYDEQALRLARGTGSPLLIKFILEAIGSTRMSLGQYQAAAAALEEARALEPPRAVTLMLLSEARFHLGQYDGAAKAADEASVFSGDGNEVRRDAMERRALALWKLGKTDEALSDVRQLMESVEQARARLVPSDFMKQGFSDTDRETTSVAIHILVDSGHEREALETAERARGRAFLDLLAGKDLRPHASAASADDAVALARRLDSTILAYWVDDISTTIWTVSPDGRIAQAHTNFGAPALEKWINEALPGPGGTAEATVAMPSRGGEPVLATRARQDSWRRLYDALIRPVRAHLPSKPGSRLTIIPHGPLFRLSFAALTDEKGRYLIENYTLHYAPAIEVFQYTLQAQQQTATLPARYLLVANPAGMPAADGKPLPPLPGAENEIRVIARLVPAGTARLLQGKQADAASVRAAMPAATVIHLATHGIISNADPLRSYLALGRTSGRLASNGRLTAQEVYSLGLHADLVVLSACRTGLGRISGDGVAGLVRAFLYAGTASVVSTIWDVADQPAAQLFETFYRSLNATAGNSKSEALRAAQLHLIRSLRKGEVLAETPLGKLRLPEDPVLWAGYVLVGEP